MGGGVSIPKNLRNPAFDQLLDPLKPKPINLLQISRNINKMKYSKASSHKFIPGKNIEYRVKN